MSNIQKKQPLISIIVPVYNGANYFVECIESILAQTYTNLEIILVNDGSTDNSGNVCDNYAEKDNRIKVIHKENGGVSSARNAGLNVVTGEYIGFVDSDDYIAPQMFQYLYNLCNRYNTQISVCNFYTIRQNQTLRENSLTSKETVLRTDKMLELSLSQLFIWNKLFSNKLKSLIYFDASCGYGEDMPVCLRLFEEAKNIAYGTKHCYYYRQHKTSATSLSKWNSKYLGYISNIQPLLEYGQKHNLEQVVFRMRKSKISFSISLLFLCIKSMPFDKKNALMLQNYIRNDLFFYLFRVSEKAIKKLFSILACVNLDLLVLLYKLSLKIRIIK